MLGAVSFDMVFDVGKFPKTEAYQYITEKLTSCVTVTTYSTLHRPAGKIRFGK
jgi:hypothetical protein